MELHCGTFCVTNGVCATKTLLAHFYVHYPPLVARRPRGGFSFFHLFVVIQFHSCAVVQLYSFTVIQLCSYTVIQLSSCMFVWLCSSTFVQSCGYVVVRIIPYICRYTNSNSHESKKISPSKLVNLTRLSSVFVL